MRLGFLLVSVMMILSSCSKEDDIHQQYAHEYEAGANKGKVMKINVMFKTTYAHSRVSLYDVENKTFIDITRGAEFSNYYELEYGKRYIFNFGRDNADLIEDNEPFVGIYIKNTTNGKIIDEYEYEGCTIGYNNSFVVL